MPRLREHERERALARDLEGRAGGRWVVLWLCYHRVFIAFFCGLSAHGVSVADRAAEGLWQRMLLADPKLWPALSAKDGRSRPRCTPPSTSDF
ncbi:hypothetical protein [Spongiactinospora sp. TRM90649]|uniref:hypothetical protein n=1 Tax=Spongiactinospora sp. TRM90649 TaxID=3031114 RepID=UPI0023F66513|nr:hypothetical protein [Spongiactinospora sp. TRM90649]MDF5756576.1 hypothetical protein [Spongiactinospora sp. TRM90649]